MSGREARQLGHLAHPDLRLFRLLSPRLLQQWLLAHPVPRADLLGQPPLQEAVPLSRLLSQLFGFLRRRTIGTALQFSSCPCLSRASSLTRRSPHRPRAWPRRKMEIQITANE